ncbi:MAG: hypothetical protein R3348_09210 [Xanthomonadales bacterium]|nr:hypothetical protein [Xanthomonadales bacterium]
MKRPIPILLTLGLIAGPVFAQQAPVELTIVGPEGWGVQILHGGPGSLPPVVLQGDEVLYPGHLDCGLAQRHPQCRSLGLLLGGDPPGQHPAPGVIIINPGSPASLLDVTVSTYPPPPVVVNGCVVTYRFVDPDGWPGPNDVQVIDASGEMILLQQLEGVAEPPAVLLDDELLNPGDVDCQVASGQWQCLWASGALVHWSEQQLWPDGVYSPEANVFVDFSVSDAPPPAVYKDGNVLNR